jgi:hypothetical protein
MKFGVVFSNVGRLRNSCRQSVSILRRERASTTQIWAWVGWLYLHSEEEERLQHKFGPVLGGCIYTPNRKSVQNPSVGWMYLYSEEEERLQHKFRPVLGGCIYTANRKSVYNTNLGLCWVAVSTLRTGRASTTQIWACVVWLYVYSEQEERLQQKFAPVLGGNKRDITAALLASLFTFQGTQE